MRAVEDTLLRLEPRLLQEDRERASPGALFDASQAPTCDEASSSVGTSGRQRHHERDRENRGDTLPGSDHDLGHTDALRETQPPSGLVSDSIPDRQTEREAPCGV
jgi:hypothetical protein